MLFFDKNSTDKINLLINNDEYIKKNWESFESKLKKIDDEYIKNAYEQQKINHERLEKFGGNKIFTLGNFIRDITKEILSLSLYYRVKGGQEVLKWIKEMIFLVCTENIWTYQGTLNNWKSDLWTADIGFNIAIAYDSIKAELSKEERSLIFNSLFNKSFLPIYEDWIHPVKKINTLDTMGHNWWSVCVSGAGIVLLALGRELEGYDEYLNSIKEGLREWIKYPGNVLQNKNANFGEDGDYIEFTDYMEYGLFNFSIFSKYSEILDGENMILSIPGCEKIPDFGVCTLYKREDKAVRINFGDTREALSVYSLPVWFFLSELFGRGDVFSYFRNTGVPIQNAFGFVFYPANLEEQEPEKLPRELVFKNFGCAVVRSGYAAEDTLFAIKTGETWNHNHRDVGTFVIVSRGSEYIVDSGKCTYSKALYTPYYRAPIAHNVVLKDGRGQREEQVDCGTKFTGSLPAYLSTENYKYLLADCTGPYSDIYQRFYRHILFIDKTILMIDDLFTYEESSELQWMIHPKGEIELEKDKITVKNQGKLEILNLYPLKKEYSREQGYLNAEKDEEGNDDFFPETDFIKVKAATDNRRAKFINLFVLPYEENKDLEVSTFGNDKLYGVEIKSSDSDMKIYCNIAADGRIAHLNSVVSYEGVETDGFISSITRNMEGNIKKITLHNGSYLKYNGVCYFSSLLKCDIVLEYSKQLECHAVLGADAMCYFKADNYDGEILIIDRISGLGMKKLLKGENHFIL